MADLTSGAKSSSASGVEPFDAAYRQLLATRPGVLASEGGGELSWLKRARERDHLRWMKQGLPSRSEEAWKYTNVAVLGEAPVYLPGELTPQTLPKRDLFPKLAVSDAFEIVFLNGHFVRAWSKLPVAGGLHLNVLSDLLDECVESGWSSARRERFLHFQKHVETSDSDRENIFAAMNTSFLNDALLIEVDPQAVIEKPIVVYFFSHAVDRTVTVSPGAFSGTALAMSVPRVFITLGALSSASMIEVHAGPKTNETARYFTNSVSDVKVGAGARLSHCRVQMEGREATHIGTTRIHQARDSWVENFQFSFGASLARQDLHVTLEGENAEVVVNGLYLVKDRQKTDHFTSIEHLKPQTSSRQLYKGILRDQARAVFSGRVLIAKDAQKSSAAQLNNNLMLSSKAEIDTKPQLEIFADDVKASHGATIGQMDPEHLFYLQTRAIPKAQAVSMLSHGFAKQVAFEIQNPALREKMMALVDEQLQSSLGAELEPETSV